jgi:hypothetical protein
MKLSRRLENAINFARFCQINKLEPLDVAELMVLIKKRVVVATNECNIPHYDSKKDDRARQRVAEKVHDMGLNLESWPGLCPYIKDKSGYPIHFPEI